MADDSEKVRELKKAYAEMLLNTSKEAAARVMVAERKTQRYRTELRATKDEALRMLLRLKHMLDAKVIKSDEEILRRKKKIEELEAQLGEAEDIVLELRGELRELQDELKLVMNNQSRPLFEKSSTTGIAIQGAIEGEGSIATSIDGKEGRNLNKLGAPIASSPVVQDGVIMTSNTRNYALNGTCSSEKCYGEDCVLNHNCIINNEPELYRNGCTQRIRASGMNRSDGSLLLSGQVDGSRKRMPMTEYKDDSVVCKRPHTMSDNTCRFEECADVISGMDTGGSCIKDKFLVLQRHGQNMTTKDGNSEDRVSLSSLVVGKNVHSGGDQRIEIVSDEVPESLVNTKSPRKKLLSGPLELTTLQEMQKRNKLHMDGLILNRHKTRSDGNVRSVDSDSKLSHVTEVRLTEPTNSVLLNCTSRRKQKASPTDPERETSLENGSSQAYIGGTKLLS